MTPEERLRLFRLFGTKSDGTITESEHQELEKCLREDREARHLWFLHHDIELKLHEAVSMDLQEGTTGWVSPTVSLPGPPPPKGSLLHRPLVAVAAGLLVGVFLSSIVWAYAVPRMTTALPEALPKPLLLFHETFEDSSFNGQKEFPSQVGQWGGDDAELVEDDEHLRAKEGRRMLRFRPAGKEKMGRVSFLTDVEKHPALLRGGTLQLELSASFHPAIPGRKTRYNLRAAAFTQEPEDIRPEWMAKEWRFIGDHSVAHAARGITREAGDLGWQTFTLTIDVPPETRRLIVSLGAYTADPMWYYLDDVRATVLERPEAR